jgi:monofunctional biosynthetic peptidoglycan transglycosylase
MRRAGRAVVAASAIAFACVAYTYLTLPDVRLLRTSNPASTAFIELRNREARAKGETPRRVQRWASYGRISSDLKRAVLVAEDSGFWQHEGIDVEQIRESLELNLERLELARGGSTITQQLAKNLYLSPSKNPARKLRELFIARRLEHELSKQRILELYLNVIEWGDGVYGAEAAARVHFRKPASALDAREAALLAGAIINPRMLNPSRPTARLLRRQRLLMSRMGAVTPPREPAPVAGVPVAAEAPPPAGPVAAEAPASAVPVAAEAPLPAVPAQPEPVTKTPDQVPETPRN